MEEYKLKTPIVLGDDTIDVLKLEEADANKLETFNISFSPEELFSAKGMKAMVACCATNITEAHAGKIKGKDLTAANEVCMGFFA